MKRDLSPARDELVQYLIKHYFRPPLGVRVEDIVGALSALIGEWVLRNVHQDQLPQEQWIISPAVNKLLLEDENCIWDQIIQTVAAIGADLDKIPSKEQTAARVVAAFGKAYPPLSVPQDHYPHEWSPNAGPVHRAKIQEIADKYGLRAGEVIVLLKQALIAMLIETKRVIPIEVATTLALEMMVAVSKMRPLEEAITLNAASGK